MIRKPKPFWTGICYTGLVGAGFILRGHIGTSGSGPAIQYWPWWGWLMLSIPGVLFIAAGLKPDSFPGLIGQLLFDFIKKKGRSGR